MTDILKTLDEWEADAKDFQRLCFGWNKDGAGPYSVRYETAEEINDKVLTLTKALRIALDNIQNASGYYTGMDEALKEIEEVLK